MLWFGKQAKGETAAAAAIEPVKLEVELDKGIAEAKLRALLKEMEERGGPQPFVEALRRKQELFAAALPLGGAVELSREDFGTLLDCVFPARRKLAPVLGELDYGSVQAAVARLLDGEGDLEQRIGDFCELVPAEQKKPRRAIWDLAAELLHFRSPEQVPLMARWVWDTRTGTGALREFVRGNDTMPEVPIDGRPGTYEAGRQWLAEVLTESGFYRDLPFMIDLLQAQAYSDYVKAMSSGVGLIDAEFGGRQDPLEFLVKLLGIESRERRVPTGDTAGPTLH
jgi:hypothetical protein